ncbi:MAG: hypothetical protein ACTHNU_08135 [Gaiellales bacterium]
MFASVIAFEEDSETQQHGIEHVLEEVIPALDGQAGVHGWWLVDRDGGRRLSVMVFDDQAAYDAAMAAISSRRAESGDDRPRPKPSSISRYDVYGSV